MLPILNFGLFQVSSYSFFTVLALIVVVAGSFLFARKRGFKDIDALIVLLGTGLSVFVGARLFNIFVNFEWYSENPSRIYSLTATGFSLYGGALLAGLVGLLICYRRKISLLKFADTVIPFIGLGIVSMRIGCFLNGCCFGEKTDLPFGVTFPPLSPAHLHQISENALGSLSVSPVHPTQIYELIAALVGTVLSLTILKNKNADGSAFMAFVVWFSLFRWVNMQWRVLPYNSDVIHYAYPALYAVVILIFGYYYFNVNSPNSLQPSDPVSLTKA